MGVKGESLPLAHNALMATVIVISKQSGETDKILNMLCSDLNGCYRFKIRFSLFQNIT